MKLIISAILIVAVFCASMERAQNAIPLVSGIKNIISFKPGCWINQAQRRLAFYNSSSLGYKFRYQGGNLMDRGGYLMTNEKFGPNSNFPIEVLYSAPGSTKSTVRTGQNNYNLKFFNRPNYQQVLTSVNSIFTNLAVMFRGLAERLNSAQVSRDSSMTMVYPVLDANLDPSKITQQVKLPHLFSPAAVSQSQQMDPLYTPSQSQTVQNQVSFAQNPFQPTQSQIQVVQSQSTQNQFPSTQQANSFLSGQNSYETFFNQGQAQKPAQSTQQTMLSGATFQQIPMQSQFVQNNQNSGQVTNFGSQTMAQRPAQIAQAPRPAQIAQAPRPAQIGQATQSAQIAQAPRPAQIAQAPRPAQTINNAQFTNSFQSSQTSTNPGQSMTYINQGSQRFAQAPFGNQQMAPNPTNGPVQDPAAPVAQSQVVRQPTVAQTANLSEDQSLLPGAQTIISPTSNQGPEMTFGSGSITASNRRFW